MKCVFCKQGEIAPKHETLERHSENGEPTVIIHNFPAEVCLVCGEEYYASSDLERAEQLMGQSPHRTAEVPVYDLSAA